MSVFDPDTQGYEVNLLVQAWVGHARRGSGHVGVGSLVRHVEAARQMSGGRCWADSCRDLFSNDYQ